MKLPTVISALLVAGAILAGCTDSEQFRVNGTIEGRPTLNLRVGYYADGAYRSIITAAREGEFEFFGSSKNPTMVEIFDYEYRPLARLYASNGETFEMHLDLDKPNEPIIEGNDISKRWATAIRDNAAEFDGGRLRANAAIEAYVAAHPDDIVSTLLVITAYNAALDPAAADSLLAMIDPQARPSSLTESFNQLLLPLVNDAVTAPLPELRYISATDSTATFRADARAASLIAFVDQADDHVSRGLDTLDRKATLELRLSADIRRGSIPDTLRRAVGRMPGGIAAHGVNRLGIPDLPFFIVVDSAGRQVYRGPSLAAAADSLTLLSK